MLGTIICDLDGVLADSTSELVKRINSKWDIGLDTFHVDKYENKEFFEKFHQVNRGWFDRQWNDEWFWARATPYLENISYLQKWDFEGADIYICTERSKDISIVTRGWLERYKVPFKEIVYADTMKKYQVALDLEAELFIDDRFFESNRVAIEGIKSFVPRHPWNKKFEDRVTNPFVYFVDNFSEIDEIAWRAK